MGLSESIEECLIGVGKFFDTENVFWKFGKQRKLKHSGLCFQFASRPLHSKDSSDLSLCDMCAHLTALLLLLLCRSEKDIDNHCR